MVRKTNTSTVKDPPDNNKKRIHQKKQKQNVEISVLPPWHSILLLVGVSLVCAMRIPTMTSSIDIATTKANITTPLFQKYISQQTLGWIRIIFAIICLVTTVATVLAKPIETNINYSKKSKLKSIPIIFRGIHRQLFFTRITWNMLGLSCGLNGLLTLCEHYGTHQQWLSENEWIYRFASWLFEVVSPSTMLVSSVVRYSIWPNALAKGSDTKNLKCLTALIQHNANLLISLIEAGLLGRIPIRFADIPLSILFQCFYVSMIWSMMRQWHPSGEPQVLYHFLDTTLGMTTTISLLVLLLVSILFNILFVFLDTILAHLNQNIFAHASFVMLIFSSLSKFRD